MKIALIDMDGTLIRGRAYNYVLRHIWEAGWRRTRLALAIAAGMPTQLLRKSSPAARVRNQQRWASNLAWLFRGASVSEVRDLMQSAYADIEPHLQHPMVEEIKGRRAEGFRAVVVSTTIHPVVVEVAGAVGADAFMGTPLQIRDGIYTGRLGGPLCSGEGKLHYIDELVREWNADVEWEASRAYSDGYPDLPMLERVGNPVTVGPDHRLAAVARERGWPSLDLSE